MSFQLWKKSVRDAFEIKDEPYWMAVAKYKSLGFRKIDETRGSWVAKFNDNGLKQRRSTTLGEFTLEHDYAWAKKAADDWFEQFADQRGVHMDPKYTVEQAGLDYIEDRRVNKSEACAADIEARFKKYLFPTAFAKLAVVDVWCTELEDFRNGCSGNKKTKNRKLQFVRAALRCAVRRKKCPSIRMGEWTLCKKFKVETFRRDIYLDKEQRQLLIENQSPEIREITKAAATTGARPGDIFRMKAGQYDPRTGTVTFSAKTAPRKIPLSAAAKEVFDRARARAVFERPAGTALADAWLFPYRKGKAWKSSRFGHHMRAAVRKAGLPKGTCLYTFRHIFITDQIVDGKWDLLTVAKYTGTSIEMIQEFYGHLTGALTEQLSRVQMI